MSQERPEVFADKEDAFFWARITELSGTPDRTAREAAARLPDIMFGANMLLDKDYAGKWANKMLTSLYRKDHPTFIALVHEVCQHLVEGYQTFLWKPPEEGEKA